jgi:glycosyltransferase involved in cell wall biosynthesis
VKGPLVSTIIPVFNGDRFLAEAIESALQQRYEPHEVIVVDDGSTDGSATVASSFPEIKLVRQAENGGLPSARNAGLEMASGEFIAFLDADDLMTGGRLESQVQYLLDHPDAAFVVGRQRIITEPGIPTPSWVRGVVPVGIWQAVAPEGAPPEAIRYETGFALTTWTWRRGSLEALGYFDPTLRFAEDLDLFLRAQEAGVRYGLLPDLVIKRRAHDQNMSNADGALRSALLQILRRHAGRLRAGGRASPLERREPGSV